jgi:ribosome modulation factor
MRHIPNKHENGWVRGLVHAEAKGRACASTGGSIEDNPYLRSEHRSSWEEGFRDQARKMNGEQS